MKKQSFIKGSLILIVSAVIAKAAGALFKIPLTNMLGGTGMGYFSCAYGLFLPIYALTANGLTTAAAKLTADNCAAGNYRNARKIYRVSLALFTAIGLAGTAAAAILARPFSEKIAACPEAALSVLMIAPSVLFGCITAVYRGCWEGMRNMYPTAVSQVIESVMRLAAGLALCSYVLNHPDKVMSFFPAGTDIISVAAAAAVAGITLSTAAGTLFLVILGADPCEKCIDNTKREDSSGKIIKSLFAVMIPVALGSIIFLALSFPVFSMLQAIGRADAPVKIMIAGVIVKFLGNILLIPIPEINVAGAAISTLLCYVLIFIMSLIIYSKAAGIRIKIFSILLPPVFSGIMCAVTANLAYNVLPFENLIALPASIAAGGIVYLIFSTLTGNFKSKA